MHPERLLDVEPGISFRQPHGLAARRSRNNGGYAERKDDHDHRALCHDGAKVGTPEGRVLDPRAREAALAEASWRARPHADLALLPGVTLWAAERPREGFLRLSRGR